MLDEYNIKGTPEVYTIAVNSQNADWEFACAVYSDMTIRGVAPDEVLFLNSQHLNMVHAVVSLFMTFW